MKRLLSMAVSIALATGCGGELSCDITDSSCQKNVYVTMLSQRGDGANPFADLPHVERISKAEYRKRLLDEAASTADPAAFDHWTEALKLLRLAPKDNAQEGAIDAQVESTAAYYLDSTKDVTIIVPDTPRAEPQLDMETLAHEFVHSVQDRELNLREQQSSFDGTLARRALIEGDAVLYDSLSYAAFIDTSVRRLDFRGHFAAWAMALRDETAKSTVPFTVAQDLVYPLAGSWLFERFDKRGNGHIRWAYSEAPQTSAAFASAADDDPQAAPVCVPLGPAGLPEAARDRFGALVVYAFLTRGLDEARAWELAQTWRGDLMRVFAKPPTAAVSFWMAVDITDSDIAAFSAKQPGLVLERRGSGLVASAANDALVWTAACDPAAAPALTAAQASALRMPARVFQRSTHAHARPKLLLQ